MLCGLMDPTEGKRAVAGHDVAREPQAVKDHIGYMAQRFGLYADLTVDENMDFYADLFGVTGAERDELSRELLRMTRMEPFRDRQAGKLSGGMKQKLALMCTLLHRPRFCFWTSRPTAWIRFRAAISGRFSTSWSRTASRCSSPPRIWTKPSAAIASA